MSTMMSTDFWAALRLLRRSSERVLIAIEQDDIDAVERLSRESETLVRELQSCFDAGGPDVDEETREGFRELVRELRAINDRVLFRLAEKRNETLQRLGELRQNRLRLVRYENVDIEPARLDVQS